MTCFTTTVYDRFTTKYVDVILYYDELYYDDLKTILLRRNYYDDVTTIDTLPRATNDEWRIVVK